MKIMKAELSWERWKDTMRNSEKAEAWRTRAVGFCCLISNWMSNTSRSLNKAKKGTFSAKFVGCFICSWNAKKFLCCISATRFTCWIGYAVNNSASCHLLKTSQGTWPWRLSTELIICPSMSHIFTIAHQKSTKPLVSKKCLSWKSYYSQKRPHLRYTNSESLRVLAFVSHVLNTRLLWCDTVHKQNLLSPCWSFDTYRIKNYVN